MSRTFHLLVAGLMGGLLAAGLSGCPTEIPSVGAPPGVRQADKADDQQTKDSAKAPKEPKSGQIHLPAPPKRNQAQLTPPKKNFTPSADPVGDVMRSGPILRFSWPEHANERHMVWKHFQASGGARGVFLSPEGTQITGTTDGKSLDGQRYSPVVRIPESDVANIIYRQVSERQSEIAYVLLKAYDHKFFSGIESAVGQPLVETKLIEGTFVAKPAPMLVITKVNDTAVNIKISL